MHSEKSRIGFGPLGKHFRAADPDGWFSFELKLPPGGAKVAIRLVYWGRDNGPEFELLAGGNVIATPKLQGAELEDYYAVEYPVAADLLAGKDNLTVRIQAKPGKPAASVYDLRLVTVK